MGRFDATPWPADLMEPLTRFGDRLTQLREGRTVRWNYDGLSAVVELGPDGDLEASFIERPTVDGVSDELAVPVYRPVDRAYRLSRDGSARMIADVVDFFTGVREPRFSFVGARLLESQL